MLLWLRHRRHPLWISRHENAVYKPDLSILRSLVVKGVPMGLQMIVISLAMIMMISMVNAYGVDYASAYGAALQLWTYIQMPAMAIGAACSRSEEHTSELQSLMRISYAVFCLKKKKQTTLKNDQLRRPQ